MRVTEEIPAALAGERLDRVVALVTNLSRREAADLIASGKVTLSGRAVAGSRKVVAGDTVIVDVPDGRAVGVEPETIEFGVVFEDADVVVVDKPAGLVVHPGAGRASGTLVNGLVARYPDIDAVGDPERPGIVHRLDGGTSGLMVVARTSSAYATLVDQMATRTVARSYLTLVLGDVEAGAGLIDAPVGRSGGDRTRMAVAASGREARTRYEVLRRHRLPIDVSFVECALETGRTHQIRVHMAAIGHPVAGDARYGGARPEFALDRPFLHAQALAFDHPATGERLHFTSPLPPDLQAVLDTLDSPG